VPSRSVSGLSLRFGLPSGSFSSSYHFCLGSSFGFNFGFGLALNSEVQAPDSDCGARCQLVVLVRGVVCNEDVNAPDVEP
jgi:hypothetical protein